MEIKMQFNIDSWMNEYLANMKDLFGSNLLFVGIQGSYGRNEATENSDIDAVAILNTVTIDDLKSYSAMLDSLPSRDKACGFISSRDDLINWERSELFQFYYDTTQIYGSLDFILPLISKEDIDRAIRIGACNIHHLCTHNIVHEKSIPILKSICKSASFTIQAIHYSNTGKYLKRKSELINLISLKEQQILKIFTQLSESSDISSDEFYLFSSVLLEWSSYLLNEYNLSDR
jgi:predicted nucleotidyltransferase